MLFWRGNARIRKKAITFLSLFTVVFMALSGCSATKGSIVILENQKGTEFTIDFKEWSSKEKCTVYLNNGDVMQFEVTHEEGEIALMVSGQKGSEPYTGNNLKSGIFTVTVSESDNYDIKITGKDATGKITVKK